MATWRVAGQDRSISNPDLRCKVGTLDVYMRRVLILEKHQQLETAETYKFRHASARDGPKIGHILP
jgi:hypothetical protein